MLSRRAADADAGASGIAATVGAAAHPSPSTPVPPSPLRPSAPLYPFRKAASLAVGATHTPLTALHNACNPPHPLQPAQPTRRPTDCHPSPPPATLRPPPHGPLLPRCLFDPLPLVTTHRVHTHTHVFTHASHARTHTHTHTYIHTHVHDARTYTRLSLHARIPSVRSNTHVSALSSGRLASPRLATTPYLAVSFTLSLSLSCSLFLSYFPLRLPSLGLSWSLRYFPSFSRPLLAAPVASLLPLCHASLPCSRKPRTYGPRNRTPNIEPLSPTSPNAFRECGPVRYPSRCLPAYLPLPACLPAWLCLPAFPPAGLHFRETPRTRRGPSGKS